MLEILEVHEDGKFLTLREIRDQVVLKRLHIFNHSRSRTAESLGVPLRTLRWWIHKLIMAEKYHIVAPSGNGAKFDLREIEKTIH